MLKFKNKSLASLWFLLIFPLVLEASHMIYHNQYMAIAVTNETLSLLFDQEYKGAYLLFHPDFQKEMKYELFEKVLHAAMFQESEGINKITFDYYLPVPGQKAIQLFYKTNYNSGKEHTLHVVLLGDSDEGYKIVYMDFVSDEGSSYNIKIYGLEKWEIPETIIIKPDTIIVTPDSLRGKIERKIEKKQERLDDFNKDKKEFNFKKIKSIVQIGIGIIFFVSVILGVMFRYILKRKYGNDF